MVLQLKFKIFLHLIHSAIPDLGIYPTHKRVQHIEDIYFHFVVKIGNPKGPTSLVNRILTGVHCIQI